MGVPVVDSVRMISVCGVAAPPIRHLFPGGDVPGGAPPSESHTKRASAALMLQAIFPVTGQPLVVRSHPLPYFRERFPRAYQSNHGSCARLGWGSSDTGGRPGA